MNTSNKNCHFHICILRCYCI